MNITTYQKDDIVGKATEMRDKMPPLPGQADVAMANSLAQGLGLSSDEAMLAMFESMRVPLLEIEKRTGWPSGWIYATRMKFEYQEMVRRCIELRAEVEVGETEDIEELFNKQIRPSAKALIEVRDNPFGKGGDRIKAAEAFLNRASKAPKSKTVQEQHRTVIELPLEEFREMQRALLEEGSRESEEVLQLVEGEGFEVVGEVQSIEAMVVE